MFKFEYQEIPPSEAPVATCIVPANWLTADLPTMGGAIQYASHSEPRGACADIVFEFSDARSSDSLFDSVGLKLHSDNESPPGVSDGEIEVSINMPASDGNESPLDRRLVLLNHLFGFNALSASVGNVYIDIADIWGLLRSSRSYSLYASQGPSPADAISSILGAARVGNARSAFVMLFCPSEIYNMAYHREISQSFSSAASHTLIGDAELKRGGSIVTALVGY